MMYLLWMLPVCVIILFGVFLGDHFKISVSDAIPVANGLIIICLYGFYLVNGLVVGYYCILLAAMLSVVFLARKFLKKDKIHFSWHMGIPFLIALLVAFFYMRNNVVMAWDEMRLWAAYPKAMYYTGESQLLPDAYLFDIMKPYIPGMPLFVFFFEKTGIVFSENMLYNSYIFWTFSLMLPMLERCRSKFVRIISPAILLMFPMLLENSYPQDYANFYKSLFIDAILGLTIGYMFSLILMDETNEKFRSISITIAMCSVVLLKESGVLFVACSFICLCILERQAKKKTSKEKNKFKSLLYIVPPIIVYITWRVSLSLYGISSHAVRLNSDVFIDWYFLKKYIKFVITAPMISCRVQVLRPFITTASILVVAVIIVTFKCLIMRKVSLKKAKIAGAVFMAALIADALFLVGLYEMYVRSFSSRILSYERYECGILQSIVFLTLAILLTVNDSAGNRKIYRIGNGIIGAVSIFIFLIVFPYYPPETYPNYEELPQIYASVDDIIAKSGGEKLMLMMDDGSDYGSDWRHHRIYLGLIGTGIRVCNYIGKDSFLVTKKEDLTDSEKLEDLYERLRKYECEWIYFPYYYEEIDERFGAVFPHYGESVMYKVSHDDNWMNISFEEVTVK